MDRKATDPLPIPDGDTRTRLLEAGLRLFAASGFDGVTTRKLAAAANANVAAVAYHFGGMKGLYHAVARNLVDETEPVMGPLRQTLAAGIRAAAGEQAVLARLAAGWAEGMLRGFLGDDRMRFRAALVMREYAQPSETFDILFASRIEPMHRVISQLAAAASGRRAEEPESIILAHAVIGQVMIFGIARVVLGARLGRDVDTPERLDQVARIVSASVVAALGLPPIHTAE